jgi:hypothetical protein
VTGSKCVLLGSRFEIFDVWIVEGAHQPFQVQPFVTTWRLEGLLPQQASAGDAGSGAVERVELGEPAPTQAKAAGDEGAHLLDARPVGQVGIGAVDAVALDAVEARGFENALGRPEAPKLTRASRREMLLLALGAGNRWWLPASVGHLAAGATEVGIGPQPVERAAAMQTDAV